MIWILEDDQNTARILGEALSQYELRTFETLEAFQQAWDLAQDKPHLVLADNGLPDGLFSDWLKAQSSSALMMSRIIIISGSDDIDLMRVCFGFGIFDFIVKPFAMSQIQIKIEQAIQTFPKFLRLESRTLMATGPEGEVKLTSLQFQIAVFMLEIFPLKVTKEQLHEEIWKGTKVNPKNIQVHVSLLRTKLKGVGVNVLFAEEAYGFVAQTNPQGDPRKTLTVPSPTGVPPPA